MTAREYLHQMRTIKYQIKVKKLELHDLREDMETIHSPSYGDSEYRADFTNMDFCCDKWEEDDND